MGDYVFRRHEASWIVGLFIVFNAGVIAAAASWTFSWKLLFFGSAVSAGIAAMCFRYLKFRIDHRSLTEERPSADKSPAADMAIVKAAWLSSGHESLPRFELLVMVTIVVLIGGLVVAWRRFGA